MWKPIVHSSRTRAFWDRRARIDGSAMRGMVAVSIAVMLLGGSCLAAPSAGPLRVSENTDSNRAETPPDTLVVSHGHVVAEGKKLSYTARAGFIPIRSDETGELMARMFIIAYTLDRRPGDAPRPLTFLWDGGPGANSSQVSMIGFGPKGIRLPATFPEWKNVPNEIVDRPETWLTSSDLVFVDPIGTGYSRATSEAYRAKLMTTHGDAEAVAEMIRVYRTRFDAFDAPLFIGGESYGTWRAMKVADALVRRRAPLAGVILMSGNYNAGQEIPDAMTQALQLSFFTATAYYHKRLPPELQSLTQDEVIRRATVWAKSEYANALSNPTSLSPEQRQAILSRLQYYTGMDPSFVDAKSLTLDKNVVMDHLLDGRRLELGRYDSRTVVPKRGDATQPWLPSNDASLAPLLDLMQGTSPVLIRYLRNVLGFRSDLLYHGPFGEGIQLQPLAKSVEGYAEDWTGMLWDNRRWWVPAPSTPAVPQSAPQSATAKVEEKSHVEAADEEPSLKAALQGSPSMQVFVMRGMYDGSCSLDEEAILRTDVRYRNRVRTGCYGAGHMIYTDVKTRQELQRDFTRFVREAGATGRP